MTSKFYVKIRRNVTNGTHSFVQTNEYVTDGDSLAQVYNDLTSAHEPEEIHVAAICGVKPDPTDTVTWASKDCQCAEDPAEKHTFHTCVFCQETYQNLDYTE